MELRTKISTFIVVKSGNLCLRIPPEAPFGKIGIRSANDIRKDGPPTPPVFKVVLYHTEASGQRLLIHSVGL